MKKTYDFMNKRGYFIALSLLLIVAGLAVTIVRGGFNLGIDFKAGLNQQVAITGDVDIDDVRKALVSLGGEVQIQTVGGSDSQQFLIRMADTGASDFVEITKGEVFQLLEKYFGAGSVEVLSVETVDPGFASDMASQTFWLTFWAMVLILVYIWIRFQLGFAVAAIGAIIHDVSFLIFFIGAFQLEVTTATIAAVLTIIGYSLNDTIVIFDRIRENLKYERGLSTEEVINTSISQSLTRTLITSATTLVAVLAIFIFGVGSIRLFAANLIVGVLVGTYSSIFVASPVYLGLHNTNVRRIAKRREQKKLGSANKKSTKTK